MAVIPARGGSTRLKDKNIYPLAGKPLISHTIEVVLESQCFDTVVVSTDSERIADTARAYPGVQIYMREAKYATEKATVLTALMAMMTEVEKHDVFAYFLPTCPLKTAADIRGGMELFDESDVDSVISVVEYDVPIQLAMLKKGDTMVPVFDNLTSGLTNSKFIQKYYRPSGAYYSARWDYLLENGNFFVGNVKGYEMSKENSIDIDDLTDMKIAEFFLEKRT